MKRYRFNSVVTTIENWEERKTETKTVMEEDSWGDWVLWSDVKKLREFLEDQIPEKRIEKLEKALGLVHNGKCPSCEQKVRGFKSPQGSFAPEAWATLKEMGIDPTTGHKTGCLLNKKG